MLAIGVVIVTYNSSDVIVQCLESLLASDHPDVRIVVCDNASTDNTVDRLREWSVSRGFRVLEIDGRSGEPMHDGVPGAVALLHTGGNLGYAGGVNAGLSTLALDPQLQLFWVLNPDTEVEPTTASAFAEKAAIAGRFGLMGGRVRYKEEPRSIQSDGGLVNTWSGVCSNLNQGLSPENAAIPDPQSLNFISGACVVVSREFLNKVGLMRDDYFLYYEEVDWALRRGDLPLILCSEAQVYHHGGTSIGSGAINRRASPFSNYFNYRSRFRFMARFFPLRLPYAYVYSILKVFQLLLLRAFSEADAIIRGMHQFPPPRTVRGKLSADAFERLFRKSG